MPDQYGFPLPAEIPSVYANNARLATSPLDFRLYFGEVLPQELSSIIVPGHTQSVGRIADRVCIVLPPETAKALIQALTTAVSDYETKIRPLKLAEQKAVPAEKK